MNLQELPLLILEHIVSFLQAKELIALSKTSKYLNDIVLSKAILQLDLSTDCKLSKKELKKTVLKLTIKSEENSESNENTHRKIIKQLDLLNLSKLNHINITFGSKKHGCYCESFYCALGLFNFEKVGTLEIQTDFACMECRELFSLLNSKVSLSLENLALHMVDFNGTDTVGLYIYCLKQIFRISSLKNLKIASISPTIIEELKLWFHPDIKYFSQHRNFSMLDSSSPDCILLQFKDQP